jgi:hypothetical protein
MTNRALKGAICVAAIVFATQASARSPSPLVPIALVEDVTSSTAAVEFMDYVGAGQIIKLEPRDVLVLSYLKSCEHETIVGGLVTIGVEQSDVQGGKVTRAKVPCNGGNMRLSSQQANASGASAFRLQSVAFDPTIYALPPVVQIPKLAANEGRTLIIERVDRAKERYEVEIDPVMADGGLYDLSKSGVHLARGALYTATLGGRTVNFKVYAKAKTGKAPIVSRLLRFSPG